MNETRRTVIYVAGAAVMGVLAWWLSPPVEISPAELQAAKIGEPFFKDFNSNDATSIRVVAFDEVKARHRTFGVKFEDGKWTIPSHHNYPADGADRLAKTATSVKGIERQELAVGGDSEQSHEKLGVVDPLDEDGTKLKGRGQRITISQGDTALVDLIVGKQLKDRPGFYYVRKVGENNTFVAKLTIDLSTKFADWIETDLLKLKSDELTEVVINNYSIDQATGKLVDGEINTLVREKPADPWKLDGLDDTKEELDTAKVSTLVSTLDDLKLAGVRPKPKGLRPDLSLDPDFVRTREDIARIGGDLQAKGYFPIADKSKSKSIHLYSNEGELTAATNKGILYTLKFGEVFQGDEKAIEVGDIKEVGDEQSAKDKSDADSTGKAQNDSAKQSSRYLFVMAQFDEKYLGAPPEKPAQPDGMAQDGVAEEESPGADKPKITPKKSPKGKPKATRPATDADAGNDTPPVKSESPKPDSAATDNDGSGDDAKSGESKADRSNASKGEEECGPPSAVDDEPETADKEGAAKSEADRKTEPATGSNDDKTDASKKEEATEEADQSEMPDQPAAEKSATGKSNPAAGGANEKAGATKDPKSPEDLKKDYEDQLKKYKSDLKAYEDKVAAGKKQADELTSRFGDWYYVISAESFNKLHLSRKELVKDKGKPTGDKNAAKPPAKDPFNLLKEGAGETQDDKTADEGEESEKGEGADAGQSKPKADDDGETSQ